jgi:hypothetical protein
MVFNPFGLSKHPWTRSVRMSHNLLRIQMEPWNFIMPSVQNNVVHMELSLHLSFQLSRSLGGYTVGTTEGFWVMTIEALAPWSHH